MTDLTKKLPGKWQIKATNFPIWLSGKRHQPTITYGLIEKRPLSFTDLVEYRTSKGKVKSIVGVDTVLETDIEWRGNGLLNLLRSRWEIVHLDDNVLIIRFEKSLLTPAGVDILVRECTEKMDFGGIKCSVETFGLSKVEYCSLTWL